MNHWGWILVVVIIIIVIMQPSILEHFDLNWPWKGWSWKGWKGWSGTSDLHTYDSGALTAKPYGSPESQGAYNYWMNRPKSWAVEYSEKRVNGDINNIRSHLKMDRNSQPALTESHSIPLEYYHDPAGYCKVNPGHHPCPNHWISKKDKKGFKSYETNMYIPALTSGVSKRMMDINDGGLIRVINPDREDQALC
jgi:hypothetical protein